jgi:hypothetical protein
MKRFAFFLLLGLGTLTVGRSRADETESTKPSSETALEIEKLPPDNIEPDNAIKPELTEPGGEEPSEAEPLMGITGEPVYHDEEEVKRDLVELSVPPPEVQLATEGPDQGQVTYATYSCPPPTANHTPEPSSLVLASIGAALIAARGYRRRRQGAEV